MKKHNFKLRLFIFLFIMFFLFKFAFITNVEASNGTNIEFGETYKGKIDSPAEMDTYSFYLETDETIRIRMVDSDQPLQPLLRLHNPTGTEVKNDYSHKYKAELVYTAIESGTFTILASDRYGTNLGEYNISIQNTKNPGNAETIQIGSTVTGSIDKTSEMDTYKFSMDNNETVRIRMVDNNQPLQPLLRLHNPTGTEVKNDYSHKYKAELVYTAIESGTFTILASDRYGTNLGEYNISIQNTKNPGNAETIQIGSTVTGSIDKTSEMDTYKFSMDNNETVRIRMVDNNQPLQPLLRLHNPTGTEVKNDYSHKYKAELVYTAIESGTFTILASDRYGTNLGEYYIYIQNTKNPGSTVSPNNDETINSSIITLAQFDTYIFYLNSGDSIRVRMADDDQPLQPLLRLQNPAGTEVKNDYSHKYKAELVYTATETGTYTILAGDRYGTNTGNYSIYFNGIGYYALPETVVYEEINEESKPIEEIAPLVGAVIGTSIILGILITAWGKYKFLSFLGLLGPLYYRTVKDNVFDNEKRLTMYNHIAENQPVIYSDIRKACNLSHGEIHWHSRMMEQMNLIRLERKGVNLFYKVYGERLSPAKFVKLTDVQKNILDLIKDKPGINQAEIIEKIKLKQQNISYNLKKLEEKDKIQITKQGKIKFYYLVE